MDKHISQTHSKKVSLPGIRKPILLAPKRKPEPILTVYNDQGEDVTPKPLNPDVYKSKEKRVSAEISDIIHLGSETSSLYVSTQSTVRFKHDLDRQTSQYKESTRSSVGSNEYLDLFITDSGAFNESATTLTEVSKVPTAMKKIPTNISLILNETSTFFLLDITSCTEIKDTDEGLQVEKENDHYDFLTIGKGKHRKIVQADTQTKSMVVKTRSTSYEKVKTQVGSAFASVYDMYDTLNDIKEGSEEEEEKDEESDEGDDEIIKLDESRSVESFKLSSDDKCLTKLMKNSKFLEACIIVERLLANNCFNEQQKVFIGLVEPDPFRDNIQYKYNLKLLWAFANNDTTGRSVNSCDFNPENKHILAVGYGKFFFHHNITGLVLIWNIKNPVQPERKYTFPKPVTALQFSRSTPVLLAVGFYDGSLKVLNISSKETMIIGENVPTFEPCWNIMWQFGRDERKNEELIIVTFDDGRICAYSMQRRLEMNQLMRVAKTDGKIKGYQAMKKCTSLIIPVTRYASALVMRLHPLDRSIYFVGTTAGTIHRCSFNYLSQHLDVFFAHEGPVHEMKFSPFLKQIIATCGDDWHTRVWAEGISEPVLTIGGMQSVLGLDWSPSHSTILVLIRGQNIEVWDVQRKVYEPQSITYSPTGSINTVIRFTDSGRCLIVGDVDGNVHVFSLEDMPFKPFFQENLIFDSLARVLVTQPLLLASIKKMRRSSRTRE